MKLSTLFLFCLCLGTILKPFHAYPDLLVAYNIYNVVFASDSMTLDVVPAKTNLLMQIKLTPENRDYFRSTSAFYINAKTRPLISYDHFFHLSDFESEPEKFAFFKSLGLEEEKSYCMQPFYFPLIKTKY